MIHVPRRRRHSRPVLWGHRRWDWTPGHEPVFTVDPRGGFSHGPHLVDVLDARGRVVYSGVATIT